MNLRLPPHLRPRRIDDEAAMPEEVELRHSSEAAAGFNEQRLETRQAFTQIIRRLRLTATTANDWSTTQQFIGESIILDSITVFPSIRGNYTLLNLQSQIQFEPDESGVLWPAADVVLAPGLQPLRLELQPKRYRLWIAVWNSTGPAVNYRDWTSIILTNRGRG